MMTCSGIGDSLFSVCPVFSYPDYAVGEAVHFVLQPIPLGPQFDNPSGAGHDYYLVAHQSHMHKRGNNFTPVQLIAVLAPPFGILHICNTVLRSFIERWRPSNVTSRARSSVTCGVRAGLLNGGSESIRSSLIAVVILSGKRSTGTKRSSNFVQALARSPHRCCSATVHKGISRASSSLDFTGFISSPSFS